MEDLSSSSSSSSSDSTTSFIECFGFLNDFFPFVSVLMQSFQLYTFMIVHGRSIEAKNIVRRSRYNMGPREYDLRAG